MESTLHVQDKDQTIALLQVSPILRKYSIASDFIVDKLECTVSDRERRKGRKCRAWKNRVHQARWVALAQSGEAKLNKPTGLGLEEDGPSAEI